MIKIIVNGAYGRMGKMAVAAIEHDDALTLVAQAGRNDNLAQLISLTHAQVVVDLTLASAALTNTQIIIDANARPVIGTSGLTEQDIVPLQQTCAAKKLGGIIAPNFSLGAVLMMQFAKQAAAYFPTAEIVERHHENKQDAPSATAIKTAEYIAAIRQNQPLACDIHDRQAIARGQRVHSIPIHAMRVPGMLAQQTVLFSAPGELLSIEHKSLDRQCFMPGILLACKQVMQMDNLVYGLEHIMLL